MTVYHGDAGDLVKRLENVAADAAGFVKVQQAKIERLEACGAAELAGIAACLDGMLLDYNPFSNASEFQTAQFECWESGWSGQNHLTLAERIIEAARWNLPLAKGYAAAHPVGSNAAYVAELEDRIAAYDEEAIK